MKLDPMFLDSLERFVKPKLNQIIERGIYLFEKNYPSEFGLIENKKLESLKPVPVAILDTIIREGKQNEKEEALWQLGERLADLDVPEEVFAPVQDTLWKSAASYLDDKWTPSFASRMQQFLAECVVKITQGLQGVEMEAVSEGSGQAAEEDELTLGDGFEDSSDDVDIDLGDDLDADNQGENEMDLDIAGEDLTEDGLEEEQDAELVMDEPVEDVEQDLNMTEEMQNSVSATENSAFEEDLVEDSLEDEELVQEESADLPSETQAENEGAMDRAADPSPQVGLEEHSDDWKAVVERAAQEHAQAVVRRYWQQCFERAVAEEIAKLRSE
ncbi:MAG: hypothetical protein OXT67_13730 [Zetaproteobacteria bacterium]|nr:hypothetical protein [Zetaproteobacteria bacterium]